MPSAASSFAAYHHMVEQAKPHTIGTMTAAEHGAAMKQALEPMVGDQLAAEAKGTTKRVVLPSGKTVSVTTVE